VKRLQKKEKLLLLETSAIILVFHEELSEMQQYCQSAK